VAIASSLQQQKRSFFTFGNRSKKSTHEPVTSSPPVTTTAQIAVPPPLQLIPEEKELALQPIVKVFSTTTYPNYFLPWHMKASKETSGSGFVVLDNSGEKRILTNAHVVANQTFVSVRKFGSSTKFTAKVIAVGHDSDIAMLGVDDPEFWEGVQPLELGGIPELQDGVNVIGYPTGGDNISITQGVVSRIELQQYVHGATNLLCVQIDAAINSGNSGGPVIKDDKVVGIAFQNLTSGENIGFIIPVPIIRHFLDDIQKTGKYTGFGSIGMICQPLDNIQLRKYFKMSHNQTGVVITSVAPTSKNKSLLRKDDVVLSMDGVRIANDGTVPFRHRGERITFDYVLMNKFIGDRVKIKLWREGKELEIEAEVGPRNFLVPVHAYDIRPSYFVYGGLVFTKLVQPYLHEYGDDWYNQSPRKLSYKALYGELEKETHEVVILSHILVDEINYGYNNCTNLEVLKFNGVKIENLRHLVELVENNKEPYTRFDLDDYGLIIMESKAAATANQRILDKHYVPSAKSQDLLQPPAPKQEPTTVGNTSERQIVA